MNHANVIAVVRGFQAAFSATPYANLPLFLPYTYCILYSEAVVLPPFLVDPSTGIFTREPLLLISRRAMVVFLVIFVLTIERT